MIWIKRIYMYVLLIRHAHAEEGDFWLKEVKSDMLRPLSKKGIQGFAQAVKGLQKNISNITHIYSSQLTRAVQTAEILDCSYQEAKFRVVDGLNPGGKISNILNLIREHKESDFIALVAHWPEVGLVSAELLTKKKETFIKLKKGSMMLIEILEDDAQLLWLLSSRQLALMGK
jgi:phosphohistidine phosphatase SixA